MSKVTNFVKLAIAIITGDDATAVALKIQKKAAATLRAQIAVKSARTLELEEVLESAQTNSANAVVNNGALIASGEAFVSTLMSCKNSLNAAQDTLDAHTETIAFLESQLEIVES
jgi:hypothetical protein